MLAAKEAVPIPLPSFSLPPGLLLVVALAGIAAWTARGSSTGWLGYGLGLAIGTLGALFAIASFTSSMSIIVENWLVTADMFRINLALTVVLITAAAAIGYVAGALITRRLARPDPGARSSFLAIALPVVAMAAVGLGYPLIVPERALLGADTPNVTLTVDSGGRVTIEPMEFRAGQAIWEITSAFDRPLYFVMVAVQTDADLQGLISGDQQGFTFVQFADAQPGQTSRSLFNVEPARYAIYAEDGGEGAEGGGKYPGESPDPIPPERLVIVDVRPQEERSRR